MSLERVSFFDGRYSGVGWDEVGDETTEQLREAFSKRGYAEHYQRGETAATETVEEERRPKKLKQVEANYRSAFGAARCGECVHYRSGHCELVEGSINADSVCDLYQPKVEDTAAEANRLFAEHYAKQPSETADVSPAKAREILRDGTVHGQPLSEAQRGMFGAIAGKDE